MTRRWASPTCSALRRNTASIMKDLIYHIPVVFFQFANLIELTGGAEFTLWKKGTNRIVKLETYSLSFFLMVYLFRNMPVRTISVNFFFTVHSFHEYVQLNQSNTRDRKIFSNKSKFFSSMLFFRAFVPSLGIKSR